MKTGIKVGDIMGKGVVAVSPEDTVKRACELMAKHDIGGICVIDKGKLVAMLTQGDIVVLVASGENPKTIKIREVMNPTPVVVAPDSDLADAAKLMIERKVKRLPVIKDGRVLGILTQTDIVRISPSVYDLIFEKARAEEGTYLDTDHELTGECEECGNYSQLLRSVNGTLMCQDCYEEIEEE